MSASFTPGPWTSNGDEILTATGVYLGRMDGRMTGHADEHAEADARLIAAAPEMHEALVNAEFLLRQASLNWKEAASMVDSFRNAAELARAALSKAQGGGQ